MYAFLFLPLIAVSLEIIGQKFFPVVTPEGKIKPFFLSLAGGIAGHFSFYLSRIAHWAVIDQINLLGALLGSAAFLLFTGIFPFLKIFFGRTD